ncbi:MAG: hypothetical protein IJR91_08305 [Ruminococcus sp.]|nr:hypothetical protein [Ruminococcus sp.]
MKRIISGLSFIAAAVMCSFSASADAPAFSVSDASGKAGDEVSVKVEISGNPGIIAFHLLADYDSGALTLVNAKSGIFPGTSFGSKEKLPFSFLWSDAVSGDYTDNGTLAELTFKIKDDAPAGEYTVSLQYDPEDVFNFDMQNVSFETSAGKITVTGGQGGASSSASGNASSAADDSSSGQKPGKKAVSEGSSRSAAEETSSAAGETPKKDSAAGDSSSAESAASAEESAAGTAKPTDTASAASSSDTSSEEVSSVVTSSVDTSSADNSSADVSFADVSSADSDPAAAESSSEAAASESGEEKSSSAPVVIIALLLAAAAAAGITVFLRKRSQ